MINFNSNNNHYCENINVGIKTHNLFGSSNVYSYNITNNLRIDNVSLNSIKMINNQNSDYGKHVFSGGNELYQYDSNIDLDKLNLDESKLKIVENFNINYNQSFTINSNNYNHYNTELSLVKSIANEYSYNLNIINNNNQHNYINIDNFYNNFNNNISNIKLFGKDYNHNKNINNMNETQLLNGLFQIQKKIDYSNYINNNLIEYPNYITSFSNFNQNKYITLKYSNILENTNKITIEFIDSENITNDNISLHIKIYKQYKTIESALYFEKLISMSSLVFLFVPVLFHLKVNLIYILIVHVDQHNSNS